jgi:hypothetical protein
MLWKVGIVTRMISRTEILTIKIQLMLRVDRHNQQEVQDKEQQEQGQEQELLEQQLLVKEVLTLTDLVIYHIL